MEEKIEQVHCNLALAIQTVIEEIVIKMAREVKELLIQIIYALLVGLL